MSGSYRVQDHYFHRAKKDHYLARAIYKLEEIQKRYRLMRQGDRVLDLGAAPGSWVQLVSEVVGSRGHVVAVDIKPIEHPFKGNVTILLRDVLEDALVEELQKDRAPFDVVLSDMAPATSGIRSADSARSSLLFERALAVAEGTLRPGGHFLAKIFQGSEFHDLLIEVKKRFRRVNVVKPDASKKTSKEIYILGMEFKGGF
jgi:23S rRNA (uridine2552-2'-O)-methyltransferase